MAKKTIYIDGVLTFGKHKGKTVEDVLKSEPSYFLWCFSSGVVTLDAAVDAAVSEWASKNSLEASKTISAGWKFAKENSLTPGGASESPFERSAPVSSPVTSVPTGKSVTNEVSFASSVKDRPAVWGSW